MRLRSAIFGSLLFFAAPAFAFDATTERTTVDATHDSVCIRQRGSQSGTTITPGGCPSLVIEDKGAGTTTLAPGVVTGVSTDAMRSTVPGIAVPPTMGSLWPRMMSQLASGALAANPYFQSGIVAPDTVQGFYFVSTTVGSTTIVISSANSGRLPNAGDVHKPITIIGAGPREGRLVTRITGYDATTGAITVADPATRAMSNAEQKIIFGSDQTASLQAAINAGVASGAGCSLPGGTYITTSGLTIPPPPVQNNFLTGSPLCTFNPGTNIVYMGPVIHAITTFYDDGLGADGTTAVNGVPGGSVVAYGNANVSFGGHIINAIFGGGTIDANFSADYAVDVPFFLHLWRFGQATQNALVADAHYGNFTIPASCRSNPAQDVCTSTELSSAGSRAIADATARDIEKIPVTALVVSGGVVTVTTGYDHGLATGRVVYISTVSGALHPAEQNWWRVTVVDARHFTLDNPAGSASWPDFATVGCPWVNGAPNPTCGQPGNVSMTMPSMHELHPIFGITNASPGVITTDTYGWGGNQQIQVFNANGTTVDGRYCAVPVDASHFQLYATNCTTPIDTTSAGSYVNSGIIQVYADPTTEQSCELYESATDVETNGIGGYGCTHGIYASRAGYDGKYQFHWFNYPENGRLEEGAWLQGDNSIMGGQVDCPAVFAFRFGAANNSVVGSNVDCSGFAVNVDGMMSNVRLEAGASAMVTGGSLKGQAAKAGSWDAANILQEVSEPNSISTPFGRLLNYSRFGLNTSLVTITQPDGIGMGNHSFVVNNNAGNAAFQATASGGDASVIVSRSGQTGLSITSTGASGGGAFINTLDGAGAYSGTPMQISPSLVTTVATTWSLGTNSTAMLGQWLGATTYNGLSLNGTLGSGTMAGLVGGGPSDTSLYVMSPGPITLRPSGSTSNVYGFTTTGATMPSLSMSGSAGATGITDTGTRTTGIDLSGATYSSGIAMALPLQGKLRWPTAAGGTANALYVDSSNPALTHLGAGTASIVMQASAYPTTDNNQSLGTPGLAFSQVAAHKVNTPPTTPASSTASCTQGDQVADANYIYVCTATNNWRRAALTSF